MGEEAGQYGRGEDFVKDIQEAQPPVVFILLLVPLLEGFKNKLC